MKDYRKIEEENLLKGNCSFCDTPIIYLVVHHINGNHKDNRKENLIVCCKRCHKIIHKGLTFSQNLSKEIIDKIKPYRLIILQKKHSENKARELVDYEEIMIGKKGQYINRNKCCICDRKKNLQYFCHPLIKKYSQSPKKFSTPICKECAKNL